MSAAVELNTGLNGKKMRDLADMVKSEIPGCGFAVIAFDLESSSGLANYVSNVSDQFMIRALELQLAALKNKRTVQTPKIADNVKQLFSRA